MSIQKEPLSIIEKYDFIQKKLASGLTKEDFCEKVGIVTAEYDTIMLVVGQSSEVRSLIEQELISPTTIKIARATADRKEWTQQQFETFIQDSVKLAEQVGKKRVTRGLVQTLISEYQPPVTTHQVQIELIAEIITKDTQSKEDKSSKPPKLKVKPPAKELEEIFIELMFDSQGG